MCSFKHIKVKLLDFGIQFTTCTIMGLLLTSNHYVPIDCSPTIWEKKTWLDTLYKFIDTGYNYWDTDEN